MNLETKTLIQSFLAIIISLISIGISVQSCSNIKSHANLPILEASKRPK